jgi:hypothetical protein
MACTIQADAASRNTQRIASRKFAATPASDTRMSPRL